MIDWVDELLAEWGHWQNKAAGVPRTGYASCSPGSQLINTSRRKSAREEKLERIAKRRVRRTVELEGGRMAPVLHMVPQAMPKQTRSSQSWERTEWPAEVDKVESVVLQMTDQQQRAVKLKYQRTLTNREAARQMGVSPAGFKNLLDGAHNFFVGYWVALRLTG